MAQWKTHQIDLVTQKPLLRGDITDLMTIQLCNKVNLYNRVPNQRSNIRSALECMPSL